MRVTSEFWVAAYMRRLRGLGVPAVLVRRGASEAGAIYIRLDIRAGEAAALRPAVAASLDMAGGRKFAWAIGPQPGAESEVEAYLARQQKYDADLFIIAIDDPAGSHHLGEDLVIEV